MFYCLREARANIAAAGNNETLVRFVQASQFSHNRPDIALCCDEEHFIVSFDHGGALGHDCPVATENCRNPCIDGWHVGAKEANFLPDQRSAIIGLDRHELCFAIGKVQHLQRAWQINQALDVE